MIAKLTEEQRRAIQERNGAPVCVVDEETKTRAWLLPDETFQKLRALFGQDEFDPGEFLPLTHEAFAEAWDAPGMAVYDDYDAQRSKS